MDKFDTFRRNSAKQIFDIEYSTKSSEESDPKQLPGGTGQGSRLGMILFLVELSDAGMPVPTQDDMSVPFPLPCVTNNEIRVKYIDDQTQGEVVELTSPLDRNAEQAGPRL